MTIVCSVCTKKNIDVWLLSSFAIIKNIIADKYSVIVPADDVKLFRDLSPAQYDIIDEDKLLPGLRERLAGHIKIKNYYRFGWYYQQLLKLAYLKTYGIDNDVIIWDADTIPLKKITLFEGEIAYYYSSGEYNENYFSQINNLLGHGKIVSESFIAQCLACRSEWINNFFDLLEIKSKNNNDDWISLIIKSIDFNQESGFSEYELLGSYFKKNYNNFFIDKKRKWFRFGSNLCEVQKCPKFIFYLCSIFFDHMTFEKWTVKGGRPKGILLLLRALYK